jgi:hypothetical protein
MWHAHLGCLKPPYMRHGLPIRPLLFDHCPLWAPANSQIRGSLTRGAFDYFLCILLFVRVCVSLYTRANVYRNVRLVAYDNTQVHDCSVCICVKICVPRGIYYILCAYTSRQANIYKASFDLHTPAWPRNHEYTSEICPLCCWHPLLAQARFPTQRYTPFHADQCRFSNVGFEFVGWFVCMQSMSR